MLGLSLWGSLDKAVRLQHRAFVSPRCVCLQQRCSQAESRQTKMSVDRVAAPFVRRGFVCSACERARFYKESAENGVEETRGVAGERCGGEGEVCGSKYEMRPGWL